MCARAAVTRNMNSIQSINLEFLLDGAIARYIAIAVCFLLEVLIQDFHQYKLKLSGILGVLRLFVRKTDYPKHGQ